MTSFALVLNDIHLGVQRVSGTTIESRRQLKQRLQIQLATMMMDFIDIDIIIDGDLFDGFEVEVSEVLAAFFTFSEWIKLSGRTLHLVLGNHDIAKNSEKLSSFAFLCQLLKSVHPVNVRVYDSGLEKIYDNLWVIPHVVNQDRFDLELEKALHIEPSMILFHANVDNKFAEEADHSLNVSDEWIEKLIKCGHQLMFAHEHQHKTIYRGNVIVCGNQWPSSIADCLPHGTAQADGLKFAHILVQDEDNPTGLPSVQMIQTWDRRDEYAEVDWRELNTPIDNTIRFLRITGEARADEAQDVITMIAKYRAKSDMFVIANAVKIEGTESLDDLSELTQEKLGEVDIMAALLAELDPKEQAAVKALWAKKDA